MIKTFKSQWMFGREVVDKNALEVGDIVEICYCDTSATCVWSFRGTVKKDDNGELFICDEHKDSNYHYCPIKNFEDDGCYVYLDKPFKH